MNQIQELFTRYQNNDKQTRQTRKEMFQAISKEHWGDMFMDKINVLNQIYQDNTLIFSALEEIVRKEITEEEALQLYESSISMYLEGSMEYQLLLPVFEKLIDFYEKKQDYEKLALLYMGAHYEANEVKCRQLSTYPYHPEFITKLLGLKEHYNSLLSAQSRKQIWEAYYIRSIIDMKRGFTTPKDAFTIYDEMHDFWNQTEGQRTEQSENELDYYPGKIKFYFSYGLFHIHQEDSETKERYLKTAKENYIYALQHSNSKFDIKPIVYASYLYYLDKKETENSVNVFEELLEMYHYVYSRYQKEEDLSLEGVQTLTEMVDILIDWKNRKNSIDDCKKIAKEFITLANTTWRYIDEEVLPAFTHLMKKIGDFIVAFSDEEIEPERVIYKTLISRNFFTYVHTRQIVELTKLLFRESYEKMPSLYANYEGMEYDELEDFVEKCARFHDAGTLDMVQILYQNMYPMTEEEKEAYKQHPVLGAKVFEKYDSLKKYKDAILGHHKHYDGNGGYPESYDNTLSFHRIITDLIFTADQINSMYDAFMQKGKQKTYEEVLKELHQGMGTKYNPMLIEVIDSSKELQEKIKQTLSVFKVNLMFEYHQDLENVIIHQNLDEFMCEIGRKATEVSHTKNVDELAPMIERLFEFAAREHSDKVYGWAYYYSMLSHGYKYEFVNAINCGLEAIRYLEKTDQYQFLTAIHINMGTYLQHQGNQESGISMFLIAAEYADLANILSYKIVAYNNLANIFKRLELYEKAINYYDLAIELSTEHKTNLLIVLLNKLYCLIMLNLKSQAAKCYQEVHKLAEDIEINSAVAFCIDVYDACYAWYIHEQKLLAQKLDNISKNILILENYSHYFDEIHAYLKLLSDMGNTDELNRQLDRYFIFCKENGIKTNFVNRLINYSIQVAFHEKDFEKALHLTKQLKELKDEQLYYQSGLINQIEANFVKDLHRQQTRRDLLKMNQELEKKAAAERSAGEAKTAFLSSMSHEIRTPIHAVIGLDEMILREAKEEAVLQYAKEIEAAGQNLLHIINDVLDFSKMEAGKVEIIPEEYHLSKLLREMSSKYRKSAEEKQLDFQLECGEELPDFLWGDDTRIKQILDNLLSNAVKFTNKGLIKLAVSAKRKNSQTVLLKFTVTDTGSGIKKEDMSSLLKPFERADHKKNVTLAGAGLGLSIVSMLVDKMNGKLEIQSDYGKGSSFSVQFPQEVRDWKEIETISLKEDTSEAEKALYAPEAQILIVDDNAVNLKVVTALLKRTGVTVTTAKSGQECLSLAENNPFHLILLDHQMPGMDGLETLSKIKEQQGFNEHTPIIALTANSDSGAADFYKGMGFIDFLAKPVDFHEMEEKIRTYLPKDLIK